MQTQQTTQIRQMTNKKLNTVICRDVKVTSALPGNKHTTQIEMSNKLHGAEAADTGAHIHTARRWLCGGGRPTHLSKSHPGEPPATCPLHEYLIRCWFTLFSSSSSVHMITSPPSFSLPQRVNMRVSRQECRVADVRVVEGFTVASLALNVPPESVHTCRTGIIYGCA